MKCSYCGNEIANNSQFCEYCGKKVVRAKSLKPLWIALAILLVLSVIGGVAVVFEQTLVEKLLQYQQGNGDYVDLGLPSGTLWKDKNESGFYTYGDAVSSFGSKLPTKEQLEELKNSCTWTWRVIGYKVVGPSGNSIFLPAAGYRDCGGSVGDVGSYGYYWFSTPDDSGSAGTLDFHSGHVDMFDNYRSYGQSVRLVQ